MTGSGRELLVWLSCMSEYYREVQRTQRSGEVDITPVRLEKVVEAQVAAHLEADPSSEPPVAMADEMLEAMREFAEVEGLTSFRPWVATCDLLATLAEARRAMLDELGIDPIGSPDPDRWRDPAEGFHTIETTASLMSPDAVAEVIDYADAAHRVASDIMLGRLYDTVTLLDRQLTDAGRVMTYRAPHLHAIPNGSEDE